MNELTSTCPKNPDCPHFVSHFVEIRPCLDKVGLGQALTKNVFYHMPMNICQPESAALIQEHEPFVIDAEQVENCRLQIVNVDGS